MTTYIKKYGMFFALFIIMAFFQVTTGGILLTPQNITNLILQNTYVIVLAIGMMLCIISGGNIDLSVGSGVALIGAILGILMVKLGINPILAVMVALVAGVLIGMWNGFWIAYVGIPSFIVTLAGMLIFRGLTIAILQGSTISPMPEIFNQISSGFLGGDYAFVISLAVGALLAAGYVMLQLKRGKSVKKKALNVVKLIALPLCIVFTFYWMGLYSGVSYTLIIAMVLVVLYSIYMSKFVSGRHIYALGGNAQAAKLSGVNVKKILFGVFVNMGVLTAVAGVLFTSRLQSATPSAGTNFELDAIAACFIGGASSSGGIGKIRGAVVGALIMGVLNNGLSLMGVGSEITMTIKGLVLLVAVAADLKGRNFSFKKLLSNNQ